MKRIHRSVTRARTLRSLRALSDALRTATAESRLAYEFNATSYTFSAMNACLVAEQAFDSLREALDSDLVTVNQLEAE
jgi:hypothetical protein